MTLFLLLGAVAVIASMLVIAQRNPVHSVLFLIVSLGALSGLYVTLDAPFVAVIQIIVYAGAIMVLFLFVVMLLNAPHEDTEEDLERSGASGTPIATSGVKGFGTLLALVLVGELVWALSRSPVDGRFGPDSVSSVAAIGRALFTTYAFPFEITSVLILVAMVGAVLLARRDTRGDV